MKWAMNWIVSMLAMMATYFYFFPGDLSDFLSDFMQGFFNSGTLLWVVFAMGTASMGYGGALLLQKLIKKENRFRNWLFMGISLLLSTGLTVLIVREIFIRILVT